MFDENDSRMLNSAEFVEMILGLRANWGVWFWPDSYVGCFRVYAVGEVNMSIVIAGKRCAFSLNPDDHTSDS